MTDQVDNWHKLARFDTNMQGELQANLLRNNGITVSLQPLSAMPGMNSGIVLWIQEADVPQAQRILDGIDTEGATTAYEGLDTAPEATLNPKTDNRNGGNV